MAKQKHIHKYLKINIGTRHKKRLIYRCALPACTHHVDALYGLMRGRECICWRCDKPFIIGRAQIKGMMTKMHCDSCIQRKSPISNIDIEQLVVESLESDDIDNMFHRLR